MEDTEMTNQDWPLYEVFIRTKAGLSHRHAGSVHAADDQMALDHARDVYTRRNEGVSIWVVKSSAMVASDPREADAFFEPAKDKIYRHPTFYEIPDGVENI
jgi:ring-1,2-phenylacetyl-CoA epoxidase subunit PaaB